VPILSGLALGGAVLTQSKAVVLAPVVGYLLFRQGRRAFLWGTAGMAAAVVPWILRNVIVLGTPSPFTNNGGYNLWVGNNPAATTGGSIVVRPALPFGETSETRAAVDFMVSQPEATMSLLFRKAMRLWEPLFIYPEAFAPGIGRTAIHIAAGILAVLVFVGFVVFVGARLFTKPPTVPDIAPVAAAVCLFYLAHLPFIAEPRFMASVYPLTVAVAVATMVFLVRRLLTHHARGLT
jgi:hypothetical protein